MATTKTETVVAKKKVNSNVRVPLQSVVIGRKVGSENKLVTPPIGQPFEFTPEEIEQIDKANPGVLSSEVTTSVESLEGGGTDL